MTQVPTPPTGGAPVPFNAEEVKNKKLVGGILGIALGGFGAHRFYLGDTTGGLIRIGLTVVTCGAAGLIGLIEGIIYITKSDQDFYNTYLVQKKAWF